MAQRTPIPLQQIAFLTSSGRVSEPWRQYLLALGDSNGNAGGGDLGPILVALAELRQQDAATVAATLLPRDEEVIAQLLMPAPRTLEQRDEAPVPTHGVQDDETLHALATSTLAGFMSAADKARLDALAAPGEDIFIAGTDFTGGSTAALTLSKSYASKYAVQVHFDASYQGTDQYNISGNTITFTSAIPVGVSTVYVRG